MLASERVSAGVWRVALSCAVSAVLAAGGLPLPALSPLTCGSLLPLRCAFP
jgi:hypothetical protein